MENKLRAFALILGCVVVTTSCLQAETAGKASVKDIFLSIANDQSAMLTSPLRMDGTDAWVWGATAVSMIALMPNYNDNSRRSLDVHLSRGVEREQVQYREFFKGLTLLGDGRVLYGLSGTSYLMASWLDKPALQRGSARWIESLVDTTVAVTVLKILAGRNRPESNESRSRFFGPKGYFSDQGANSSFPSGHTALSFATAAVLTRESQNDLRVAIPAYLIAGGVGFSRVYVEKHWVTDAVIGAALGQSIGMLVENRHNKTELTKSEWRPLLQTDVAGIQWIYHW